MTRVDTAGAPRGDDVMTFPFAISPKSLVVKAKFSVVLRGENTSVDFHSCAAHGHRMELRPPSTPCTIRVWRTRPSRSGRSSMPRSGTRAAQSWGVGARAAQSPPRTGSDRCVIAIVWGNKIAEVGQHESDVGIAPSRATFGRVRGSRRVLAGEHKCDPIM